ncbi:MAG TPA: hypothetical protein VIN59_09295 [Alphaproteobacteria bacterium]
MTSEKEIQEQFNDAESEGEGSSSSSGSSSGGGISFNDTYYQNKSDNDNESVEIANIPNVEAVRNGNTISYFYISPPEALKMGWQPRFHIGDDDGSGQGLGGVVARAAALHARFTEQLADFNRRAEGEATARRRDGENPDEENEDGAEFAHYAATPTQDTSEVREVPEYDVGNTGLQNVEYDPNIGRIHAMADETNKVVDRTNNIPMPENIPIESAGTPEVSPPTDDERLRGDAALAAISQNIPQEARDTPNEPLDPDKLKTRIMGVIPPGEHVPEMQNIPGAPSGPERPEPEP